MTIPLPGAGLVYSLFKDVWSRLQGLRLPHAEAFQRWTVDQWYHPTAAIDQFGDQDLVARRDEAHREANRLWKEVPSGVGITPEEYTSARHRADHASQRVGALGALLQEGLKARLVNGELIARGFREPFSHGAPYLTISRHEWRIIKLEPPDRAAGGSVSYVGLTIGKVGTKSFFRYRR